MLQSKESIQKMSASEWEQTTRSIMSPRPRYFKMNFLDNSLSEEIHDSPKEEEKVREYIQQIQKDNERQNNIKNAMKKKFFQIRNIREKKLSQPPQLLNVEKLSEDLFTTSYFQSSSREIKKRSDVQKQIRNILDYSLSVKKSGQKNKYKKVRTRSELNRKNKKIIDEEKAMIRKIIKKSESTVAPEKKWEDLTNKDKFLMDYSTYLKKKRLVDIEKDIYENKIRKKTKQIEKFQDFILEEVNFSSDHREKLSRFFNKIRYEFRRIQSHEKC